MSRELMQQALEKLEFFAHMKSVSEDTTKLITALRQALVDADDISLESVDETVKSEHALTQATGQWNPLCTAPQKREWVGLTDEDMEALFLNEDGVRFARYIEAKIKEKNT